MILLDTNYLIRCLIKGSREYREVLRWREAGEALGTPAPCWYEFECGPVTRAQAAVVKSLLSEIVPFGEGEAVEAARLFNAAGRRRRLRADAMVAGCAVAAAAALATSNVEDFEPFVGHGLQLRGGE
jgi:predicted nucleic acid-binding protein